MPLESYDPRWLELLRDAGRAEMTILVDDVNEGVTLRALLYRIRGEMQKAKHPDYTAASRVKISVVMEGHSGSKKSFVSRKATPVPEDLKSVYLLLTPDKFSKILDTQGYKIPEEPEL